MAAVVTQIVAQVLRSIADVAGTPVSASTTITLTDAGTGIDPIKFPTAATTISFATANINSGTFHTSATTTVNLGGSALPRNSSIQVSATTSLGLGQVTARSFPWLVSAAIGVRVTDRAVALVRSGPGVISVSAVSTIALADLPDTGSARLLFVSATTGISLSATGYDQALALHFVQAFTTVGLSGAGSEVRSTDSAAATTLAMAPVAGAYRFAYATATTALGLTSPGRSNAFPTDPAATTVTFSGLALAVKDNPHLASGVRLRDHASAVVVLPASGGGLRTRLGALISGTYPASYAETPNGLILIANGFDPMIRWDALNGSTETAGVIPPARAIDLGGVGVGTITGRRVAFQRFIDAYGNYSSFSPVSNLVDFGRDSLIEGVTSTLGGPVVIRSSNHGLATGEQVVIAGLVGDDWLNGTRAITVVDGDSFAINGVVGMGGQFTGRGSWTWGVATVGYSNVPAPTETKVVRRQILRNLAGNMDTFYVDIDTDDLVSTAFLSTLDDETLAAGEAAPLDTDDDLPSANRFGVPPAHKAVVVSHLGRVFGAAEINVTGGHCEVALNSPTVQGVGTHWQPSLVGRLLYIVGASVGYAIAAVDPVNQVITLAEDYADASDAFGEYAIRPAPAERRLVYFTEPSLPEAWPPWNAISIPETSDEIVGLMVKGAFVFILERRHIWKFTFQTDPARDGFVFLTTQRGAINDRCWALVEDTAYMLDEIGIHKFDGQDSEAISTPIQDVFQQGGGTEYRINWNADQTLWHCAHDPNREMLRWFVAMSGQLVPRHAICFNYRLKRWFIEEYPHPITASATATIGYRRSLVGTEARRVICLNEGSLDGVEPGYAIRGSVTASSPLTLTDATAPLPAISLAGVPVAIVSGKGAAQARLIVDNTADTLTIDRPWGIQPDGTSVYQVGGISWHWRSGWFRYVDDESSNPRDVEVIYNPSRVAQSLDMELFYDHAACPRPWGLTRSQDGVATVAGDPRIEVDLTTRSGWAQQRMEGHRDPYAPGDRFVSIRLSGVQAGELVRVYQVTLNGVMAP